MSIATQPTRTVLVTGAAKRLGREIALALAADGWQIAVHYRHSLAEAEKTAFDCRQNLNDTTGKKAIALAANFENEAEVRALLPRAIAQFGTIDAVVNNASVFEHDSATSFGYAAMDKHFRSNTGAGILLAQALYAHLSARNASGVVVNLLDQKLWNPNPDFFSYTLSKAALEAANTLLAQALAPQLRVVGVAPGLTLTSHMLSDEKFEDLHRQSPLGRSSTVADVVNTVKFALDNRAITGTTVLVDGGQHLMRFDRDFSMM